MGGLLPAASLRAGPSSDVVRASNVIPKVTLVLAMIPLCSYARVECLQGVASARSMPSTNGAALFATISSAIRWGRPAVLLACWALGAEPEDLLSTFQPDFVRKVPLVCIVFVIPLSQQDRVLCDAWMLKPLCSLCFLSTLQAARVFFADTGVRCCRVCLTLCYAML